MNFEDLATKEDVEKLAQSINVLANAMSVQIEKDEVLTIKQGAELIKMPFHTFKKKVEKGLVASSKAGKSRTVLKSDVMKFWKKYRTPARDEFRFLNQIS